EFTRVTAEAIYLWQKAKLKNDFKAFQKHLEHIVSLVRKKADLIGFKDHPYDALIDEFEPGCTTEELDLLFNEIKFASRAIVKKQKKKTAPLTIAATPESQVQICRDILELVGFDWSCGRFDLSAHPFSSSYHPYDSRLTTRAESHGVIT